MKKMTTVCVYYTGESCTPNRVLVVEASRDEVQEAIDGLADEDGFYNNKAVRSLLQAAGLVVHEPDMLVVSPYEGAINHESTDGWDNDVDRAEFR